MDYKIIIITGLPGTGKTHLAVKLSEFLNIPLISKDGLKETLFDTLGSYDREWSRKLGASSMHLLFYVAQAHMKTKTQLILECNFNPHFDNLHFNEFSKKYNISYIQILCYADGGVLYERFMNRALSGERHIGHNDAHTLEEHKEKLFKGKIAALDIPGELIEVDTTFFDAVDYPLIFHEVQSLLTNSPRLTN